MTPRQILTTRSMLTIALVAIVCVACGAGFMMFQPSPTIAETTEPREALPVITIVAKKVNSFAVPRTYTGVLKARRMTELGFERTGRLTGIDVQEGDSVQAGAMLASLDTANLDARLLQVRAEKKAADARLKELIAGPRAETIATAKAEVRDFESRLELAEADFERVETLWNASAISQREFDSSRFSFSSAKGRLDAAQSRLKELETGTRQEQIDIQQAVVDQAAAAIKSLNVDIAGSSIAAPFDAVVAKRMVDEGTIVSPATPIFRLVERNHPEAWVGLPESIALTYSEQHLESDKTETLIVAGKEYTAKLKAVLPELDSATRTRTAIFELIDKGDRLLPGSIARIKLEGQTELEGIWLPVSALTRGQRGLWSAFVVESDSDDGHTAVRRDVEILHTDTNRVLVRGLIDEGDRIVAKGTHRITSGQRVAIIEPQAAETAKVAELPLNENSDLNQRTWHNNSQGSK